jgi:type I restriction enzyme, S subunit
MVPAGAIIFVVRGMSLKSEFRVGVTQREVAFGQDCKAIIPISGIYPPFLAHCLRAGAPSILQLVDEAGHGTGRLETKLIQQLNVRIPSLEEQWRLVGIVTSADDEVTRLADELTKLQAIKKGLMDDLLTGRVRVVH